MSKSSLKASLLEKVVKFNYTEPLSWGEEGGYAVKLAVVVKKRGGVSPDPRAGESSNKPL